MKITLLTATGAFVHSEEILPFNEYPQVIIWGERVFSKTTLGEYRECFFYVIPTQGIA
jgi:hypothetical protein